MDLEVVEEVSGGGGCGKRVALWDLDEVLPTVDDGIGRKGGGAEPIDDDDWILLLFCDPIWVEFECSTLSDSVWESL